MKRGPSQIWDQCGTCPWSGGICHGPVCRLDVDPTFGGGQIIIAIADMRYIACRLALPGSGISTPPALGLSACTVDLSPGMILTLHMVWLVSICYTEHADQPTAVMLLIPMKYRIELADRPKPDLGWQQVSKCRI